MENNKINYSNFTKNSLIVELQNRFNKYVKNIKEEKNKRILDYTTNVFIKDAPLELNTIAKMKSMSREVKDFIRFLDFFAISNIHLNSSHVTSTLLHSSKRHVEFVEIFTDSTDPNKPFKINLDRILERFNLYEIGSSLKAYDEKETLEETIEKGYLNTLRQNKNLRLFEQTEIEKSTFEKIIKFIIAENIKTRKTIESKNLIHRKLVDIVDLSRNAKDAYKNLIILNYIPDEEENKKINERTQTKKSPSNKESKLEIENRLLNHAFDILKKNESFLLERKSFIQQNTSVELRIEDVKKIIKIVFKKTLVLKVRELVKKLNEEYTKQFLQKDIFKFNIRKIESGSAAYYDFFIKFKDFLNDNGISTNLNMDNFFINNIYAGSLYEKINSATKLFKNDFTVNHPVYQLFENNKIVFNSNNDTIPPITFKNTINVSPALIENGFEYLISNMKYVINKEIKNNEIDLSNLLNSYVEELKLLKDSFILLIQKFNNRKNIASFVKLNEHYEADFTVIINLLVDSSVPLIYQEESFYNNVNNMLKYIKESKGVKND